jgi:conjugative relaxase-like TrwC/TraI family protein
MWTVHKVRVAIDDRKGAASAASYVLAPGDSPSAFAPRREEEGGPEPVAYWLGSEGALKRLGLAPGQKVEQKQLEMALQGRNMDGNQVRRPGSIRRQVRDDSGKVMKEEGKAITETKLGVVSYDLTFSAPKSVSVIWARADQVLREKIERAMLEAWNLATEHLIRAHDVVMHGRDKETGKPVYGAADGFAAAASLQVLARRAKDDPAPAPQLHVHGMLVGLQRPDGILAGINSAAIYGDPALEAGAYARALLAERLSDLGFEIEPSTGRHGLYFEVKGLPEGLTDAFSGRTHEIEAELAKIEKEEEREVNSREEARLAMFTRLAKDGNANAEETTAWWEERMEKFAFTPAALRKLIGEPGYGLNPEDAREWLAAAVEKCIRQRGPTVTRAAARAIVMAASPGRMTLPEAEAMVAELQAEGALLALEEGRVTSPSIRTEEEEVRDHMVRAAEREYEPLSASALAAGMEYASRSLGKHELDPEQLQAIAQLGEGAGWSILTGRAGTGKTPVLQALAEGHRRDGWEVISCAIDWGTAGELAEAIGDESSESIRQLLLKANDPGEYGIEVGRRTLILIDEAGKIGLEQWLGLARLVDETGARLLAVGHAGQIGAIELPGMFEEMVRHREVLQIAELHEIRRHNHEWMRELQVAIDKGNKGELAVELLQRNNALEIYDTRELAQEAMVDRWFGAQSKLGPDEAVMIVQGRNEEIEAINQLAQERRLHAGQISGPSVAAPGSKIKFYAGDQVVLRQAAYSLDREAGGKRPKAVQNGTWGVVLGVDAKRNRMTVELREPRGVRQVEVDLERPPRKDSEFGEPQWRLGYALHPNPAQGLTFHSVFHLGGYWTQDQESSYVALSRQQEFLLDFIDRESLEGESDEDILKAYARRLSYSRRREASIRFEERPEWAISDDLAAGRELPEGVGHGLDPEPKIDRSLAELLDPLAAHRRVLGTERAGKIEERAEGYAGVVGRMGMATLRNERATMREALERLDRAGAMRTLELEREREAFEEEIERLLSHAESLETRALASYEEYSDEEREQMLAVANVQEGLAKEDAERREAVIDKEVELRKAGAHLDNWLREEGDAASRYVALERELFERREQGLEDDIEAVLREPPADIAAQVGPAPEAGEPAREEWEEVVYELECNRLIAEGEIPAAAPSKRELQYLDRRIERLRGRRGLGNPALDFEGVPRTPGRQPK